MTHLQFKLPSALRDLLGDPAVKKVGLGMATEDAKRFRTEYNATVENVVDVLERAQRYGFHKKGLKKFVDKFCGMDLNKSEQVSSWGASKLSTPPHEHFGPFYLFKLMYVGFSGMSQIHYAATDAYATLLLFYKVEAARAAILGLTADPNRIYFIDKISELHEIIESMVPTTSVVNLATQHPKVKTPRGSTKRSIVLPNGQSREEPLPHSLYEIKMAGLRNSTRYVDKFGEVVSPEAPKPPQPTQKPQPLPRPPVVAAPIVLTPSEALTGTLPATPVSYTPLVLPAPLQLSVPMMTVAVSTFEGLARQVERLTAELEIANAKNELLQRELEYVKEDDSRLFAAVAQFMSSAERRQQSTATVASMAPVHKADVPPAQTLPAVPEAPPAAIVVKGAPVSAAPAPAPSHPLPAPAAVPLAPPAVVDSINNQNQVPLPSGAFEFKKSTENSNVLLIPRSVPADRSKLESVHSQALSEFLAWNESNKKLHSAGTSRRQSLR